MKKLMIAACAVALAAASQAATISWKSTGKYYEGGKVATSITGGTFALLAISASDAADFAKGEWDGTFIQEVSASPSILSSGGNKGKVSTTLKPEADTFKFADGDYLVTVFKDGTTGAYSYLAYTADDSLVTDTLKVEGLASTGNLWDTTASFASKGAFTTQSVPEPTSALLMLLGVAGLALRRRRA